MKFKECKLCKLGEIVGGATPLTKEEGNYGGEIPWITPKDLTRLNGRYINKGERNITEKGYKSTSTKMLPVNSILFSSRAPIGYIAINNKNEVCTNQGFKSIIPNNNTDYMFLYYLIKHNKEHIEKMGTGTTFKEVSGTVMKNIKVMVPTKKREQAQIAYILSKIDDKIELNNEINNNLQKLCNIVFTKWFCEYDYPDENNNPYKSSKGKMKNSKLGKIPQNWEIGEFQDIICFSNGYCFKSNDLLDKEDDETYKVFKQGNININGGINEEKTKSWFYKERSKGLEKFVLKKGDILMCMTDMKNSTSPLLGHTALMNVDNEYIVNQRVGLIRCKKDITDYPYVYTMSNLEYFLKNIRSKANSGVQVNLSTKEICETKIVIPCKEIINKYNNFAKPLYEIMFNNQKENKDLEKLRDILLPKLMNGEIYLAN